MMRSLFSAVSGLRTHQTRMDVIGNNVANVNTPGFKTSRVTFQEVFSQTLQGASSPSDLSLTQRGGMNPLQVGLGVDVAGIDTSHTPGNLQPTSRTTDVAIEGQGFFLVREGGINAFTRVGAFDTDGDGVLVDAEGRKVLGWMADSRGTLPSDRSSPGLLNPIRIAIGSNMPASATTGIRWEKNLNTAAEDGFVKTSPVTVYDSQGRSHTVTVLFTKTSTANQWNWEAVFQGTSLGSGLLEFDSSGRFLVNRGPNPGDPPEVPEFLLDTLAGVDPIHVTMDFSAVSQVAGPTTVDAPNIDGCPSGSLESFTFDSKGVITGFYSNGQTRVLGQLALANFANPGGLQKVGKSLFHESNNSGRPEIGEAGTSGRGMVAPSSLEMSNVDLAEEFTQMIVTQRGFQANSRIITVADELLQELVNLKR